jgi:hypothetical protein
MYNNFGDHPQYHGTFAGDTLVLAARVPAPGKPFDQQVRWYSEGEIVRLEVLNDAELPLGGPGRSIKGLFALTEHNNLQGACDLGMLPDRLPGTIQRSSIPVPSRPSVPSQATVR